MIRRIAISALAVLALAGVAAGSAEARTCRGGDPPIQVSARTSCGLGGAAVNYAFNRRVFYRSRTVWLRSPVTRKHYRVTLTPSHRSDGWVLTGTGPNGIWMRFGYDIGGY